jgi:hypothetical protein
MAVFRRVALLGALITLSLAGCTSVVTSSVMDGAPKHIFFIMMENQGAGEILGNTADAPTINQLAHQYGVATQYYGVTHPSLPNYLAVFSGDTQGIFDDCKAGATSTCPPAEFVTGSSDLHGVQLLTPSQMSTAATTPHLFTGQNLVDQLEAGQLTWKAYMQSMPSVGYTGEFWPTTANAQGTPTVRKLYAQKHNPFEYFADITSNPARMQRIVPYAQLATDLHNNTVPNFVWITPDQCHDMHGVSEDNAAALGIPDCYSTKTSTDTVDHSAITLGDTYLSQVVPQIMGSAAWGEGSVLVIAWDEDDYSGYAGCCGSPIGLNHTTLGGANAPLLVITSAGAHPIQWTMPANHYTLLATIEHIWGLPCLAHACDIPANQLLMALF